MNGRAVASGRIERTIPFIFGVETADVGVDLYSTVTPEYAKGDNRFTGTIRQVRIDVTNPSDTLLAHPVLELVDHRGG